MEAKAHRPQVDELWPVIAEFAEELHRQRAIDTVDALAFITSRLRR